MNGEGAASIWKFAPLTAYTPPPPSVMETAKRRVKTIWRRLRPDVEPPLTEPVKSAEALSQLADRQLDRAAPAPTWAAAAGALDEVLGPWSTSDGQEPSEGSALRLVVTPPHVNRYAFLAAWAQERAWRIVDPPARGQLLSAETPWLSDQFGDGAPWVLPALDQLYLRDADGLHLVRTFLDRAHTGTLGRGLVGCDSWAWAYLSHVWRGWLPPVLTLAAFDEKRLARAFRKLADAGGSSSRFRQADSGADVVPALDGDENVVNGSPFLHELAAYSRGNLGVAWAIWRCALQTEPDSEQPVEDDVGPDRASRTVWVKPWEEINHPSLPASAGDAAAFVLHTLLLHAGLPATLLTRLLPMPQAEVREALDVLWAAGLIEQVDGSWYVTAPGYPTVRAFLHDGGYLTDAL